MANNKKPEHDSEGRVCCRCLSYLKWSGFARDSRWFIWHKSHCKFCEQIARSKKNIPMYVYNSKTKEETKLYPSSLCGNKIPEGETTLKKCNDNLDDLLYDQTSVFIQWFILWFMIASLLYLIVVSISI